MAVQLVDSQVVPPMGVTPFINGLANGYNDVLNISHAENGNTLIIFKPQGTYQPVKPNPYTPETP